MPQLNNEQLLFFYNEILGEFGWCDEVEESGVDPLKFVLDERRAMRKEIDRLSGVAVFRQISRPTQRAADAPKSAPVCTCSMDDGIHEWNCALESARR